MSALLEIAHRVAIEAAELAERLRREGVEVAGTKTSPIDIVTEADRATEVAVRDVLAAARPGDAILGEEGGTTGAGARRWIIDPIDGTAEFVTGGDRWLVLVALEEDGEIVAAVAAVPAQGRIWWAGRGSGAFEGNLDGTASRRIHVDDRHPPLAGSRLGVIPVAPNVLPSDVTTAAPLTALAPAVEWDVHAALLVANGSLDLALQTRGQVWDFAATSLIVTEAGGCYGGVDGIRGPQPGVSLFAADRDLWAAAHDVLWPGAARGLS